MSLFPSGWVLIALVENNTLSECRQFNQQKLDGTPQQKDHQSSFGGKKHALFKTFFYIETKDAVAMRYFSYTVKSEHFLGAFQVLKYTFRNFKYHKKLKLFFLIFLKKSISFEITQNYDPSGSKNAAPFHGFDVFS